MLNYGKKYRFLILIILVLFFNFPILIQFNNITQNFSNEFDEEPNISGYWSLNHSVIIYGDSDWQALKNNKEWCTGSGNKTDPYVIEDLVFDEQQNPSTLLRIYVWNSSVHFRIENCTFINIRYSGGLCIHLDHVSNGTIINSQISSSTHGIFLWDCTNCTITENNILNNEVNAIFTRNCEHVEISNNTVNNNEYGMAIISCDNMTVLENEASFNNAYGISLNNSQLIVIANNSASYNGEQGIAANLCNELSILNNEVAHNFEYGIGMQSCVYCTVQENTVSYSGYYGIALKYSNYNLIKGNVLINNGVGCIGENETIGNMIIDNTCIYNYWDFFTTPIGMSLMVYFVLMPFLAIGFYSQLKRIKKERI